MISMETADSYDTYIKNRASRRRKIWLLSENDPSYNLSLSNFHPICFGRQACGFRVLAGCESLPQRNESKNQAQESIERSSLIHG